GAPLAWPPGAWLWSRGEARDDPTQRNVMSWHVRCRSSSRNRSSSNMASIDNSSDSVPIPALLVERATALARAEVGLALVHTRRIAIGAVGALLGTIVACAFAQLALVLLVAWPVL